MKPIVRISAPFGHRFEEIITPQALHFIATLQCRFNERRQQLLMARKCRQADFNNDALPDFLTETKSIRDGNWTVATIPDDLQDRRVEITGPTDRKMVINALNSGAKVFMADFEDANSPTWANCIVGQINLKDRWSGTLDFSDAISGKVYALNSNPAVLMVRPRGWHLLEDHVTVDGESISASLFDFGLYAFHNAHEAMEQGSGAYFYLPKLESHLEARLWNDVFVVAQSLLDLPNGSLKATVLIETLPAAFEMDEILYEMRDHIVGLNCGRWDYIFSFIKKSACNKAFSLPDRGQVVMGKAFLRAYSLLLIKTCHRRGALAIGGMAAQIPIRHNPEANFSAFAKVRVDKEREAMDGHDGTWVAHPDLVPVALDVFDRLMPTSNQISKRYDDLTMTARELLQVHEGTRSEGAFRENIRVGVQYIEAWLRGRGAVPIYNVMEDAATAEISRAQIWQQIKHGLDLDSLGGVKVIASKHLFDKALPEEVERIKGEIGEDVYVNGRFAEAIKLFSELSSAPEFSDFLTIPAYELLKTPIAISDSYHCSTNAPAVHP